MFYSDKETEEEEKKFKEEVERVYEYVAKQMAENGGGLYALIEEGYELMKNKQPSPEQLARLDEIMAQIDVVNEINKKNLVILEENVVRNTSFIYHELKKKAEDGNVEAMKAYLDLKPEYESLVLSRIGNN